ncbi:hypothetical protein U9R90_05245 [Streptomyces sp. E11-3]|uniref:hypothetical protein n=1 Tax=Streptomyces sp. E11-3 TaxID=3110112 RepID=UPI0039806709
MTDNYRSYTAAERRTRGWLVLRGAKQAVADCVDPSLENRIDRIDERAEDRGRREVTAMARELEAARNNAAAAKAAEQVADRNDKPALRQARRDAEKTLTRVEQAARHLGF